jgi:hypothetical protein
MYNRKEKNRTGAGAAVRRRVRIDSLISKSIWLGFSSRRGLLSRKKWRIFGAQEKCPHLTAL